jgi:hypothetical protein
VLGNGRDREVKTIRESDAEEFFQGMRVCGNPASSDREMWEKDIGNITAAGSPVRKTIVAAAGRQSQLRVRLMT